MTISERVSVYAKRFDGKFSERSGRRSMPVWLRRLESESIHIIREVAAGFAAPVMLYSIGKDSAVMLHLALKAFWPMRPDFPLLHVDTGWKFSEMIGFRDLIAGQLGLNMLVHTNEEGRRRGIDPIRSGSEIHTQVMKTEALRQALTSGGFDAAFGGARRDEEASRAKERIFSFRTADHGWDPKNQRPELWSIYNTRTGPGESIRVFPLSNWTEQDIWTYIGMEDIPVVPLYFAARRPTLIRDGAILMCDDHRLVPAAGESMELRMIRFRTLGCYPLTAAIESHAATVGEIIDEIGHARSSERAGRLIDSDQGASMERKKREGYF